LAAAIGRRHWPICWCCLDRGPGSFDVEDATTLSWSSAAVSESLNICVSSNANSKSTVTTIGFRPTTEDEHFIKRSGEARGFAVVGL